jgi:hypothetical protein
MSVRFQSNKGKTSIKLLFQQKYISANNIFLNQRLLWGRGYPLGLRTQGREFDPRRERLRAKVNKMKRVFGFPLIFIEGGLVAAGGFCLLVGSILWGVFTHSEFYNIPLTLPTIGGVLMFLGLLMIEHDWDIDLGGLT